MTQRQAVVACAFIAVGGAVSRLPGLSVPPLDFHPTRQYRSAIIARGYSLDLMRGPAAQRQIAARAAATMPPIEPPVMELGVARLYHAMGREDLAAARLVAVTAWTLGAVALAWLALQTLAPPGAVAAVAVMMFLPFGIAASRSFQPDPFMCALVVLSLAAAVHHLRRPRLHSGLLLMAAAGGAVLVKAVAVFFLAAPIAVLIWSADGSPSHKLRTAVLVALSLVPAAWYYTRLPLATAYGPFFQLLDQRQFWLDWSTMLSRVVTWPVLSVAAIGTLIAERPVRQMLVVSLIAYVAFGIVFTHHIHTHDYYSLPLIPIAAIGIGAFVSGLARLTDRPSLAIAAASVVVSLCVVSGSLSVVEAQSSTRQAALRAEADRLTRIGELVGHSERVISLEGAYGLPLI
jgi:4-amino-4-deoxy-L-arabinose transferase-like glycosyltransferase